MENKRFWHNVIVGVSLILLVLVVTPPVWVHFYPDSRMLSEEKLFNCYNGKNCTVNYVWTFCVSRDITDGPLAKYFTDGDYIVVPQDDPWRKRKYLIVYGDNGDYTQWPDANSYFTSFFKESRMSYDEQKNAARQLMHQWQKGKEFPTSIDMDVGYLLRDVFRARRLEKLRIFK